MREEIRLIIQFFDQTKFLYVGNMHPIFSSPAIVRNHNDERMDLVFVAHDVHDAHDVLRGQGQDVVLHVLELLDTHRDALGMHDKPFRENLVEQEGKQNQVDMELICFMKFKNPKNETMTIGDYGTDLNK